MQQQFSATLDTVSKIITGLMAPLFTLFPIILYLALRKETDRSYEWLLIGIMILLPLIFFACYLLWPKKYILTDTELKIVRTINTKTYYRKNFAKVQRVTKQDMGWVVRIFGNGGLFGYTGYFTSKTFGRMLWYVTNRENTVLITLDNGNQIVISPDDTDAFAKALA